MDFFNTSAKPEKSIDTLSNQILAQISNRTDEEKQMILQLIKNSLEFRDLPDNNSQK